MSMQHSTAYGAPSILESFSASSMLLLKISRFRFWIYTAGTYVVGFALGAKSLSDFFAPEYYLYLFYFFVPANIFIYGVNDYWDQDTDRLNPKKDHREHRVRQFELRTIRTALVAVVAFSLLLMAFQSPLEMLAFGLFLFLAYFYSAGPLRFKSRPGLDSLSNVLYLMPGIFGFVLVSGELPPMLIVVAGVMHTTAMHLFSAVPDIKYDTDAGIETSATRLGKRNALVLCFSMWSVLAGLAFVLSDMHPLSLLALVYPAIPAYLLLKEEASVERLYWYLPYINTSLGGLLWAALVLRLL